MAERGLVLARRRLELLDAGHEARRTGGAGRSRRRRALAPGLLRPGTYVEPFAQRALGVVREDDELIAGSASRFDELGLDWHAADTRALGSGDQLVELG